MSFSLKPDYDVVKKRYDAFWHQAVVDRPLLTLSVPKTDRRPVPRKSYPTQRERWLDVGFRAEVAAVELANREYLADALPVAWPNMGPEIFSAWCGCPYNFGETTTWSEPAILDWERDEAATGFDPEHELFRLTVEFTERLLELGRGNFIVGLTDFHPGGDHLAALRDPQTLAMDMIENPEWVRKKLVSAAEEYIQAYEIFYAMLREADMPITTWTPLIHEGRYYVPSNDFSIMISKEMYDEVFLSGIIDECRYLDRSIYHLDGPGALRHLDSLLEIPELDAVQWIYGAGNEGYVKWIEVYQRIQNAGKSLQVNGVTLDDLPLVFETLRPEGVWLSGVGGVADRGTAEEVIRRVERWK